MQVPDGSGSLQSRGYRRYHCYSAAQIQLFEAYLALDAAHSIQSCATIWGSKRLPRITLPMIVTWQAVCRKTN